jgi:glycosyltransferase involved in cell wall biosynthesis
MSQSSRRRVAHVLRKYDPEAWGGTESHVAELTRRLGPHGFDSEVWAPAGPTAPDRALAPGVALRRYHAFCPFYGPREARAALFANAGNIASIDLPARLAAGAVDLAHVHTGKRIGGAVRTAMRLRGRPYVVSVHGPLLAEAALVADDTARRLEGLVDLGRPLGLVLGARRVLDDAARVICFNDDEHRALVRRVGARAVRLDHGVDAARFAGGDAARARARFPALGGGTIVLQVGRIAEQKNQVLSVAAFAAGAPPDARLVLAGAETDRGYGARVLDEARAAGVADRVVLLGNVASGDLADLYAAATLCLVPSKHEAFGLVVLEAWAARRPVLFADRAGLGDLARALGDRSPAIHGDSVATWSAAIGAMLADPARRAAAVADGARLLGDRFAWERVAERTAAVYDEAIEERARRRGSRTSPSFALERVALP